MRSQSLFNFFTKAADVTQTAAGTRIHTGASATAAKANMAAAGNKRYQAEQKRRSGMTEQQRWDEDFNNHLSDQAGAGKDQYNLAYDNYSKDLDDAVARGSMTKQQAESARQHIISGVRDKQRQFHSDYLKSYDNGDHTDSDRQGIRGTKIWTTHGDNGLVHFRHGDFGENTTFGGAERGYAQRDARTAAGAGRGGAGASGGRAGAGAAAGVRGGAQGSAPQMPRTQAARPNDASRAYDMQYGPKQPAQAQQPQAPAAPTATDPASTTARQGNSMMRGGAQANASNVTPTAPPSPITFKGGYTVGGVNGNVDWAAKGDGSINVGGAKLTADQYNAFNNIRSSLATQLRQQEGISHTEARARATQMANQWMADQTAVANGGKAQNRWQHVENPQPAAQAPATKPGAQPEAQQPGQQPVQQPVQPDAQQPVQPATPPQAPDGEIDSMAPFTAPKPAAGQNAGAQPGAQEQAPNTAQQAAGQPVTWDLEAGKKDPMGYIKHHTQALDADTIGGWKLTGENREGWATQDGKLSAKGYNAAMAGRHFNNMQNLERLARDGRFSDNEKKEIMMALNREAARYSYYGNQNRISKSNSTVAYDPKLHGPNSLGVTQLEEQLSKGPIEFGWGHSLLSNDTKAYSDEFFKF